MERLFFKFENAKAHMRYRILFHGETIIESYNKYKCLNAVYAHMKKYNYVNSNHYQMIICTNAQKKEA